MGEAPKSNNVYYINFGGNIAEPEFVSDTAVPPLPPVETGPLVPRNATSEDMEEYKKRLLAARDAFDLVKGKRAKVPQKALRGEGYDEYNKVLQEYLGFGAANKLIITDEQRLSAHEEVEEFRRNRAQESSSHSGKPAA